MINNESVISFFYNETAYQFYSELVDIHYDKYVFFAVCSALVGLPLNILLLVILIRNGLFSRRNNNNNNNNDSTQISYLRNTPTGSFERFLFEIIFIDTLLILYHFMDNFLSYIHKDRSAGQHYLIHVSDFCCKFFTYFAKMSVLLATWLLFFLILNQFILTMKYNEEYSCWNRSLYYINAKYSTVFLIFICGIYNIYPIEVLKYQKKEDLQDYQQVEGVAGVCSILLDATNKQLLNATNYGYNLLGISMPCIIIFITSIIIIYRTCQNKKYDEKLNNSFQYIAATIGIIHSFFNLPSRLSDILLMSLSPYSPFYSYLINFNHEVQSFITLSYAYKCFICIILSRRFRFHAKNILCFLIENKYEDRYQNRTNRLLKLNNQTQHYITNLRSLKIPVNQPTTKKFSVQTINNDNLCSYTISEALYWIRPYFTRNKKQHLLRPWARSASCHQLSTTFSSSHTLSPSSRIITHPTPYFVLINLPNGFIGNTLALITFSSPRMRQISSSIFLLILSISDSIALITSLWFFLADAFSIQLQNYSALACRFRTFFAYVFMDLSSWCIVGLAFDRFLRTEIPLRSKRICTPRNALVMISICFLILCGINGHYFSPGIGQERGGNRTTAHCLENRETYPKYYYFYKIIWPKIDMIVFCFLPACIMILCNIRIIYILRRNRHHFENHGNTIEQITITNIHLTLNGISPMKRTSSHRKAIERQMSLMMLSCVIVFLCTTVPVTIYLIFIEQTIVNNPKFARDGAYYIFIFRMLRAIMYLHFACNFYLYCLTSQIFRGEFLQTITCRKFVFKTNQDGTSLGLNRMIDTSTV
ncbi:unnamed protein product [Rotaria sp. Silwood1]|nr:unnamed protein product [Rotaria sp. Silwood1]CAF3376751.1 unnamed protein product [Rotaria sp. Silwood1]CAF4624140.1 unnamed protein product [Rotaria sp. Silwood1]CAF4630249.1 unnamed protein product [Rotaria sp. Silwood1]